MKTKIRSLLNFPSEVWKMIIGYLPGPIGYTLRQSFWRKRLNFLGKNVRIDIGVHFQNPQHVSLDDNCWIDRNVTILAGPPNSDRIIYHKKNSEFSLDTGEVYIGKMTHIAPNCVLSGIGGLFIGRNLTIASNSSIYSFSHHYRNLNDKSDTHQYSFTSLARIDQQSMILSPVVIEDFCAVGLNCVVLPGSTLKKGTWVACGTVVSGIYPEQSLLNYNQGIRTKTLSNLKIRE